MMEYLPDMIKTALILAVLGSIDSLLTSLVEDSVTRTYHNSNRELIGQGIGNTIAGIFGGLPGAGATMRTVVNVKAGGLTPISGALHAVILLVVVLGDGALAANIPKAVLAGILFKVSTDIIGWDYLKKLRTAPRAGVVLMFTVLLMTLFIDLIMAVATGMVMAAMIFMKRMSDLQLESAVAISLPTEESKLNEEERNILNDAQGRIILYYMEGPLSFGAAKGMVPRLAQFKEYDALVLDLSGVPAVDFTSCMALNDIISDTLALTNRFIFIVGLRPNVQRILEKQGVLDKVDKRHIYSDRHTALLHAARLINIVPNDGKAD